MCNIIIFLIHQWKTYFKHGNYRGSLCLFFYVNGMPYPAQMLFGELKARHPMTSTCRRFELGKTVVLKGVHNNVSFYKNRWEPRIN